MVDIATRVCRRCVLAALAGLFLLPLAGKAAIAEPKSFSVYFDKQSSQLSPTAKEIVGLVISFIKPPARVTITGNCDTSESEPDKLSLARATEVQKALLNAVVPLSTTITISGKGTSQPRKPTGPNVAEPTNRYVVITIE